MAQDKRRGRNRFNRQYIREHQRHLDKTKGPWRGALGGTGATVYGSAHELIAQLKRDPRTV